MQSRVVWNRFGLQSHKILSTHYLWIDILYHTLTHAIPCNVYAENLNTLEFKWSWWYCSAIVHSVYLNLIGLDGFGKSVAFAFNFFFCAYSCSLVPSRMLLRFLVTIRCVFSVCRISACLLKCVVSISPIFTEGGISNATHYLLLAHFEINTLN